MISSFKDLGLSEPLLRALEDMEFEQPTEVQKQAIPHVLNGKDVIVMSKTGSGKTAVFGMSVLQLTDPADKGPQCLILEPTRELAVQVDNDLHKMSKHVQHTSTAVYGQHNIRTEIEALKKNVTFVSGTPGRVFDHIEQGNLKTNNIKYLVLDEVDRMMDMGFIDQVRRILRTLPRNRVTLLFSATIPAEIERLCRQFMRDPVTITIESETLTVDTIDQKYYRVERNEKRTQLNRLLLMEQPETCMIFCNTKIAVDQVQSYLTKKGYDVRSLHGDIPQNKRMTNIQQFKKGGYRILVATDVAARGIHVEDLSLVINYDVPNELDSYIHRIGRTGRAGHDGRALTLVTSEDIMSLYAIEERIGTLIPQAELPSDEELAQQKESADAWVKANAVKVSPARQQSDSGSRDSNRKRSSRKKSTQRGRGQNQGQGQAQTGQSQAGQARSGQGSGAAANQSKSGQQAQAGRSHEGRKSSYDQSKQQTSNQRKPVAGEYRGQTSGDQRRQASGDQLRPGAGDQGKRPLTSKNEQLASVGAAASASQKHGKPSGANTQQGAAARNTNVSAANQDKPVEKKSFFKKVLGKLFSKESN